MTQIKIENTYLLPVAGFLHNVQTMSAKQSRARTKLVNALSDAGGEYVESQRVIVEDLGGVVDEKDNSVKFPVEDHQSLKVAKAQIEELSQEVIVIDESFVGQFAVLQEFFSNWDGKVSNVDADGYDKLMDVLDEL